MKRAVLYFLLSVALILMASGCGQEHVNVLSAEDAAARKIADAAVLEEYRLDDLEDYKIILQHPPITPDITKVIYQLKICGYDTDDYIEVSVTKDGSVSEISDHTGKFSIFLDRVDLWDIGWAKFRLGWKLIKYLDEEHFYSLYVGADGNLNMAVELIDHFRHPDTDTNGNTLTGCGRDHEHISFHVLLCTAPDS